MGPVAREIEARTQMLKQLAERKAEMLNRTNGEEKSFSLSNSDIKKRENQEDVVNDLLPVAAQDPKGEQALAELHAMTDEKLTAMTRQEKMALIQNVAPHVNNEDV